MIGGELRHSHTDGHKSVTSPSDMNSIPLRSQQGQNSFFVNVAVFQMNIPALYTNRKFRRIQRGKNKLAQTGKKQTKKQEAGKT